MSSRRHLFSGLQRFQETIHHAIRTRITLRRNFSPQVHPPVASLLPPLKHIGCVGIKIAVIFSSLPHIGSGSPLEPMSHRPFCHAYLMCNLLSGQPLFAQANAPLRSDSAALRAGSQPLVSPVDSVQDATLAQAVKGSPVAQARLPFA